MSRNDGSAVVVKLFIDKEKRRVLFAESDKEFVDVLFSFLTLPFGTVVRLLGKRCQVGCLDELYRSLEDLGADHFQTKACRTMLLGPRNAAAVHCDRLGVKVDDTNHVYCCRYPFCGSSKFSSVPDAVCKCGSVVQHHGQWPNKGSGAATVGDRKEDGVFVIGGPKFIITDYLQVSPASTRVMFSLINRFGIPDKRNIEEKVLQLNSFRIVSLLRRALLSKHPLTGLYFDVAKIAEGAYNASEDTNLSSCSHAGQEYAIYRYQIKWNFSFALLFRKLDIDIDTRDHVYLKGHEDGRESGLEDTRIKLMVLQSPKEVVTIVSACVTL